MTEAERLAQGLDKEQIDTVRRDMLNHEAASLLRAQAAEIERLKAKDTAMLDHYVSKCVAAETAKLRAELEAIKSAEPTYYVDEKQFLFYSAKRAKFLALDLDSLTPLHTHPAPKPDHTALLRQALEALEKAADTTYSDTCLAQFNAAIAAIKEELK